MPIVLAAIKRESHHRSVAELERKAVPAPPLSSNPRENPISHLVSKLIRGSLPCHVVLVLIEKHSLAPALRDLGKIVFKDLIIPDLTVDNISLNSLVYQMALQLHCLVLY